MAAYEVVWRGPLVRGEPVRAGEETIQNVCDGDGRSVDEGGNSQFFHPREWPQDRDVLLIRRLS